MATNKRTVKPTADTQRDDKTGILKCPKCGADMVPLKGKAAGKGWGCSKNIWPNPKRLPSCDGMVYNKTAWKTKEQIPRAATFPVIPKPTAQQLEVMRLMGEAPGVRGGRCIIIDAGPGTAKTTTISAGTAHLYRRLRNLSGFAVCAFNVNADNVLKSKLPAEVPDVATLNSWHGRAQGFKFGQYDAKKLSGIFADLVDHLPKDERPRLGIVGKVVERMRDVCLYNGDASDKTWWTEAVATVCARFPGLAKKIKEDKSALALVMDYAPELTARAQRIESKIDIQEQISRPMSSACAKTGWRMRFDCCAKPAAQWTADDVAHFAKLVRAIELPQLSGMIVDESQDLSLCQVAIVLAQTFRTGELILIGDDNNGEPGDDDYKAGQAIYGWRGAFPGVLKLVARLWEHLTGENVVRSALTITFRHGPETCDAYRPLNRVIQSGKPAGFSKVWRVSADQAFTAWLDVPEGKNALWITRTNAPLAGLLRDTIKACAECCIRGSGELTGQVDGVLYSCAGYHTQAGEYPQTTLKGALAKLREIIAEQEAESNGQADPNSMERFVLEMGEMIDKEPQLLAKAELPTVASVGNLRRFVAYFATKDARRVLTTVYRCKGDEADVSIVADVSRFNESWGDPYEDAACRHVAASRGKELTLFVGQLAGTVAPTAPGSEFKGEDGDDLGLDLGFEDDDAPPKSGRLF